MVTSIPSVSQEGKSVEITLSLIWNELQVLKTKLVSVEEALKGRPTKIKRVSAKGPIRGFEDAAGDLLNTVTHDLQSLWVGTYGAEFVINELTKAKLWCAANPQRAPRVAWGRFLTAWFGRAWEKERKQSKATVTYRKDIDNDEPL